MAIRAGIQKCITQAEKRGYHKVIIEYLTNATDTVEKTEFLYRYIGACCRAGQDPHMIIDEVTRYKDLPDYKSFLMTVDYSGDPLLGKDKKCIDRIVQSCQCKRDYAYMIACIYEVTKNRNFSHYLESFIKQNSNAAVMFSVLLSAILDLLLDPQGERFHWLYKNPHKVFFLKFAHEVLADLIENTNESYEAKFFERQGFSIISRLLAPSAKSDYYEMLTAYQVLHQTDRPDFDALLQYTRTENTSEDPCDFLRGPEAGIFDFTAFYEILENRSGWSRTFSYIFRDMSQKINEEMDFWEDIGWRMEGDSEDILYLYDQGLIKSMLKAALAYKNIEPEDNAEETDEDILFTGTEEICSFSVCSPLTSYQIEKNQNGNIFFTITAYKNTECSIDKNRQITIYGGRCTGSTTLFFTANGNVFMKTGYGRGKYIPLVLKKLKPILNNPYVRDLFVHYAKEHKCYLLIDVLNDIRACESPQTTITLEQACKYHTKEEYFRTEYKKASQLRINYNRMNINLSYMLVKAMDLVTIGSYGILQNVRNIQTLPITHGRIQERTKDFIRNIYTMERNIPSSATLTDYINIAVDTKDKIHLNWSERRMEEEHVAQTHEDNIRKTEDFTIPENSKFNQLRQILPKEFEWIRDRARLVKETEIMHHCVWSYAHKIGTDNCAIYSYYDKDGQFDISGQGAAKRYTIEFVHDGKTKEYRVVQIQTAYDRFGGDKLYSYLREKLSENEPLLKK